MLENLIGLGSNVSVPSRTAETQQTRQLQESRSVQSSQNSERQSSANQSTERNQQLSPEERRTARLQEDLQNVFNGVSLNQVAEEGLGNISNDVTRIRELAEQANDESLTDDQRAEIQTSITELQDGIRDTIEDTSFAGQNLLNEDGSINFNISGREAEEGGSSNLSDVLNIDVTTEEGRENARQATDDAQDLLNGFQDDINASLSRFNEASRGLASFQNLSQEASEATATGSDRLAEVQRSLATIGSNQRSTSSSDLLSNIQSIQDASAASDGASSQILSNSDTAIQAQANQSAQSVLQLLG